MNNTSSTRYVLRICAIGAGISLLMLIVMVCLVKILHFVSASDIVQNGIPMDIAFQGKLIDHTRILTSIDVVFIIGWILSMIGIATLVRTRSKVLGDVALVIGLIAPLLDFTENEILLAMVQYMRYNDTLKVVWIIIRQFSYLVAFAAAAVIFVGLWSEKKQDRIMCMAGTIPMIPAIFGLYIPWLFFLVIFWYACWFVCVFWFLWSWSTHRLPENTEIQKSVY